MAVSPPQVQVLALEGCGSDMAPGGAAWMARESRKFSGLAPCGKVSIDGVRAEVFCRIVRSRTRARVAKSVDARDLSEIEHPDAETAGVNGVKVGEPAARRGGCNTELSPPALALPAVAASIGESVET